jgi:hypothetical protein
LYNADHKAGQVKDPNAHQFQAMQQDEIAKRTLQQTQTVQPPEASEGEVKIRDRQQNRDKDDRRGKKRKKGTYEDSSEAASDEPKGKAGRLDLLA